VQYVSGNRTKDLEQQTISIVRTQHFVLGSRTEPMSLLDILNFYKTEKRHVTEDSITTKCVFGLSSFIYRHMGLQNHL